MNGSSRTYHHVAGGNFAQNLVWRLLICTALVPVPAMAQEAAETDEAAGKPQLEEIIVTAQRREQNLQDTPVTVSAFSAETLSATGITNVSELTQLEPSLNVPHIAGVYLPFLRGVGNAAGGSLGNEASVPVYIDDMYYTRLSTAYLAIDSVDRVEILKGPQGTLFGRNSSGGAIQMFTKDPGNGPEFSASLGYGNYDTRTGQLYVSTPITNNLSWNFAAGGTHQRSGWGKSITTGDDAYLEKYATIRSKLLWEPGSETRVKIVGFYAYTNGDAGVAQDRHSGTYGGSPAVALPGYPSPQISLPSLADVPGASFYDTRLNFRQVAREEGYGGSVRIDQGLGFAEVVSITGFRTSKGLVRIDGDLSAQPYRKLELNSKDDQFTQELQLKSKPGSPVDFILGAFYLHNKVEYDPAAISGDSVALALGPGAVQNIYSQQKINSYSAFGQASFPILADTNITGGLRYTRDEISGFGQITALRPVTGETPLSAAFRGDKTYKRMTWKVALDHHFSDDIMAYGSISRGYKAGTFSTLPLNKPPARPEVVDAYELGFKSELFDRRIRLNGALFWNEIKDPQVLLVVSSGLVSGVALSNAEKARVKGGEVAVEAIATDNLKFRGAATYLDAKYVKYTNAPFYGQNAVTITPPVAGDASGNRLPNASKWRFEVGGSYTLETGAGEWSADLSVAYTGKFAWNPDNFIREDPYTLVNASISFTPASLDNLTLTLWGKNLGGAKYYAITQENSGGAGTGGFQASAAPPLTFGGKVTVKF